MQAAARTPAEAASIGCACREAAMVATRTDTAHAVMEDFILSRHRSLVREVGFYEAMSQTRQAIAASREVLRRFRERQGDDTARAKNADRGPVAVSAFDADIIRAACRDLIAEMNVPECQWRELARSLVREFVACEETEAGLVDWIVRRPAMTKTDEAGRPEPAGEAANEPGVSRPQSTRANRSPGDLLRGNCGDPRIGNFGERLGQFDPPRL